LTSGGGVDVSDDGGGEVQLMMVMTLLIALTMVIRILVVDCSDG
jgi:hypothetical protein